MQALEASSYSNASRSNLFRATWTSLWNDITGNFDVVYCYGLLDYLEDPDPALSVYGSQFQRRELANLGADPE